FVCGSASVPPGATVSTSSTPSVVFTVPGSAGVHTSASIRSRCSLSQQSTIDCAPTSTSSSPPSIVSTGKGSSPLQVVIRSGVATSSVLVHTLTPSVTYQPLPAQYASA